MPWGWPLASCRARPPSLSKACKSSASFSDLPLKRYATETRNAKLLAPRCLRDEVVHGRAVAGWCCPSPSPRGWSCTVGPACAFATTGFVDPCLSFCISMCAVCTPKLAQWRAQAQNQRMAQRGGRTLLGLGVRVACCCIVWFGSSIAIICELRTRTPLTHASQARPLVCAAQTRTSTT